MDRVRVRVEVRTTGARLTACVVRPGVWQWVEDIKSVYKDVEDVDFLVGTLAESPRPKGYIISETSFYVFIMNASRRLLCDRFFQARAVSLCAYAEPMTLNSHEQKITTETLPTMGPALRRSVGAPCRFPA